MDGTHHLWRFSWGFWKGMSRPLSYAKVTFRTDQGVVAVHKPQFHCSTFGHLDQSVAKPGV